MATNHVSEHVVLDWGEVRLQERKTTILIKITKKKQISKAK